MKGIACVRRREFLKAVAATLFLGPALLKAQPPILLDDYQTLAPKLRAILEMTTLHHRSGVDIQNSITQNLFGEAMLIRNSLLNQNIPIRTNPKTLLFCGHITDTHILDEESPARVAAAELFLEELGVRSGYYPNEDLTLQVFDSMIKTLNTIHNESNLDFLINTGDSLDNAQNNELGWFIRMIEGGRIDPDTGSDEDPLFGSNNDSNDPFLVYGLNKKIPYYTAIGNHDILVQGNVPEQFRELYNAIAKKVMESMTIPNPVGNWSNAVLSPWINPPDPHNFKPGYVVADNSRRPVTGNEFIRQHIYAPTFRPVLGFPKSIANQEYGYYSFYPKANLPIKVVVLDTALRLGTAIGAIHQTQFKDFLIPQLEDAKAKKELVIIVSHHPGKSIKTLPIGREEMLRRCGRNPEMQKMLAELLAPFEKDNSYISGNEFEQTLMSYPNIILHLAGHRHCHQISQIGEPGHGYWEIQTASLLTYPQQARLLEIVYEGNNIGAIHTCIVDHQSNENSLAARARTLAYKDAYPSKNYQRWMGQSQDRNTILRFSILPEIAQKLENL